MDVFFTFVASWLCIMYASVFIQNRSYGALMVSLGSLATLIAGSHGLDERFANVFLIVGRILFWSGLGILATFDREKERNRLRNSSWIDIIFGKVPTHLQTSKVPETQQVAITGLVSSFCGILFLLAGAFEMSTVFLVIAGIYGFYFLWLWPRNTEKNNKDA